MRKTIVILFVMSHVAILMGQQESTDTLYFSMDEAMLFAMENNLNAKNARLDVDAADQRIWVRPLASPYQLRWAPQPRPPSIVTGCFPQG